MLTHRPWSYYRKVNTVVPLHIVVISLDWVNSGAPWWSHSLIGVDLINLINWMEWIRGSGAPRAPI